VGKKKFNLSTPPRLDILLKTTGKSKYPHTLSLEVCFWDTLLVEKKISTTTPPRLDILLKTRGKSTYPHILSRAVFSGHFYKGGKNVFNESTPQIIFKCHKARVH